MDRFPELFRSDVDREIIDCLRAGLNQAVLYAVNKRNFSVRTSTVRVLLESGADPNFNPNPMCSPNNTVLCLTIRNKNHEIVELLLEPQFNTRVILDDVYYACRHGNPLILAKMKKFINKCMSAGYDPSGIPGHYVKLRGCEMVKQALLGDKVDNVMYLLEEKLIHIDHIKMALNDNKRDNSISSETLALINSKFLTVL